MGEVIKLRSVSEELGIIDKSYENYRKLTLV